jgi:hypothetical protein
VTQRSTARGLTLGILAGIGVLLAYALLAEPLELTYGLLVIGFVGGWLIGNGISFGTWRGREHDTDRALRWAALVISTLAWVCALGLAFVISQALVPQASTSLASRATLTGFVDYFTGLEGNFIHFIAFALMAFMAWRGAR